MVSKITRIAYNTSFWRRPTGDSANLEKNTHNSENGFGYEDWLFRDEWEIGGWRYAFLQGVNKSRRSLLKENVPFDVTLFTIKPEKRIQNKKLRQYIAEIAQVECLSGEQANDALDVFKSRGWFDLMRKEVEEAGGDVTTLDFPKYTTDILNIRFKRSNVSFFSPDTFANADDPIIGLTRYQLTDKKDGSRKIECSARTGSNDLPQEYEYVRSGSSSVVICPEHVKMQKKLMLLLKEKFPERSVIREKNFIDVQVETVSDRWLFEIKTDLSPRSVLRQAIGQLLEYEHFQTDRDGKKIHLIVVGRKHASSDDSAYIRHLQKNFNLPIEYWVVEID